jgi:hypothetical protein
MYSSSFFCLWAGVACAAPRFKLALRGLAGRSASEELDGGGRRFSEEREGCSSGAVSCRGSSLVVERAGCEDAVDSVGTDDIEAVDDDDTRPSAASSAVRKCVCAKLRLRSEMPLRCRSLRFCGSSRGLRGSEREDMARASSSGN